MPSMLSVPWLAVGALLSLFANGRWTIAVAAWLAPVFLLRFVRLESGTMGILWLLLVLLLATLWAFRGLIPAPAGAMVAISALIALVNLLPFLADHLLAPRVPGFVATLVFPLTWAMLDFAALRASPYGTWGAVAYTQYGNLPLMQLASVTGTPGIAFLIGWFASVMNWAWEKTFDWSAVQGGLLTYSLVWSAVMFFGSARLICQRAPAKTVRCAAIGWPESLAQQSEFMRALEPKLSTEQRDNLRKMFKYIHDYFLDTSRREARAGANLIVWPEANAMVFAEDEAALLERARQLAREEKVYLAIGVAKVYSGTLRPFENKAVLLDPAGNIALSYVKAIPVPGFEARMSRRGARRLLSYDSPHGRIALAICYDLDFPHYVRQVGNAKADLLVVPASDWEAIKLAHHNSAVFRAIENGVSLLRATRWGLSAAVDPYGRVLAQLDPFMRGDQALVAQVPVKSVRTIYASLGDWFGWLCVAGFLTLLVGVAALS